MQYDIVIGGAGLFGATIANLAVKQGKSVLVLENNEVGGMCADENGNSKHGPHLFHTDDLSLWNWVNKFNHFVPVHYSPLVVYKDLMFSFPINKLTLHQLSIDENTIREPRGRNFEEACIRSVGAKLYEMFFYHYTRKMWGREPRELPASLFKRIPVRSDYNTSYFRDRYVGVPLNGYSSMIKSMMRGAEIQRGDFIREHKKFDGIKIFTGSIDSFYDYDMGVLPYRGVNIEEVDAIDAMAINYTDDREYTREINYNYLLGCKTMRETPGDGDMYPTPWGLDVYSKYTGRSDVIFAGRLGSYQYINMDQTIENAVSLWGDILKQALC